MKARLATALLAASLAAFAAACGGGYTAPSNNVTDNKTGTLAPAGVSDVFTFNVSHTGEYTITVTSMDPAFGGFFVVNFGYVVSGQCSPFNSNTLAQVGQAASASSITPGSYCVYLQDEGFLTTTETFNLKINHPN